MSDATIEHGKINGAFRRWHQNGALAEEIRMTSNVPDGLSRAYYPNGTLKAQAKLDKGEVVEQQFWKEGEASASRTAQ
jgi:antitoxin component YwqK of YwqJK toxin-antitoxin module